jgi:uncharacterized membrane protein
MKNRNVGWLIIGISFIIGLIVFIFNQALKSIVGESCSHGPTCPMYGTIQVQTYISLVIAALIFLIGLFFVLTKESERIIIKKIKPTLNISPKKFDKKLLEKLNSEEKTIMNLLLENKGNMLQSELVTKTEFGKVKITRILDSLEAQGFIERKRRGMTNVVFLKSN